MTAGRIIKTLLAHNVRPFTIMACAILVLAVMDRGSGFFFSVGTVFSVMQLFATLGLVALGLGLSVLIREFDLSVAGIVGLAGLLDRKPSQLSGGQRQRVALGRAIIAETRVCLMDEPLSNLDAKLRQEMRTEIRSLQQRLGITMVYVTHDQTEAMTMADRVVLLRDGRIEQIGTPEQLYNRPATTFVARFIGTPPMNIISRGGTLIGVRPENIYIVSQGGHQAQVEAVEHLGADSIVICNIGGQRVTVRQDGFSQVAPGETVEIAWAIANERRFDVETGGQPPKPG